MKEESVTDAVVRQFLLGEVDDDERRRIESLFISDAGTRERILGAEDDLVEDYLEDCLPASDREKFLAQYGYAPQQRRKLRIARSIKEYAVAEAALNATSSVIPKRRTLLSGLRWRSPIAFIPVAATLAIGFVATMILLVEMNRKRTLDHNRRAAIAREVADLNAPASLREVPPQMSSIVLPPVALRSAAPQAELTPQTGTRVVELQLLWTQKEQYPEYRAVLRRVGNTDNQITIPNLHVENTLGGRAVRVRLPTHLLSPGLYQVSLNGVATDGAPGQDEEYSFMFGG